MPRKAQISLLLLLAGCIDLPNPVDVTVHTLPATVELRPGQSVDLPGDHRVAFNSITEESRCPVGVRCFWEGNAGARLSLKSGTTIARDCTLHTTLEPRATDFGGIAIVLSRVDPYPVWGKTIHPSDYVITLDIDWLTR